MLLRLAAPITRAGAYPPTRSHHDLGIESSYLFDDVRRTLEADFERIDQLTKRLQEDGTSQTKQYRREWNTELSTGREWYHESVVVSRGPSTAGRRGHAQSPVPGFLGVALATVGAVLYISKAREFRDIADETVYRDPRRLAPIAPLLMAFSSKFRDECARARERQLDRRRGEANKTSGAAAVDVKHVDLETLID